MYYSVHIILHISYCDNISELGVNNNNVNMRASQLVDTLTMFYSLPAVHGVILWGFWDGRIWENEAAMYEGSSVTVSVELNLQIIFREDDIF